MPTKADKKLPNITMEDVRLIFKNFSGRATEMNNAGNRNFCVVLPKDIYDMMKEQGYNVKERPPREEGDEPLRYLQVKIKYGQKPPNITMVTSRGRTRLDEEDLQLLDWAYIKKVDLIVGPYHYTVGGKAGISCYVQTMFVTIDEDELELKYADVPESGASSREWTIDE